MPVGFQGLYGSLAPSSEIGRLGVCVHDDCGGEEPLETTMNFEIIEGSKT